MASYLDKAQVNTALTDNTKLDLGHQSIMTADFMQLNVATIQELVPGSKIDVKMESFARLNPLPVPTFGRASMRNRAFFVPFRTIYRGWNDFITDAVHVASDGWGASSSASLLSSVPVVDMKVLVDAFGTSVGELSTSYAMLYPAEDPDEFDVDYNSTHYDFTVRGRQAIKLVEQLGYKLDWDAKLGDKVFSAMPLLALAKIYVDWYFPQQYSNLSIYDSLLALCNYDTSNGPLNLNVTQVMNILTMCMFVQYDSDLFVSAWDQPNQPNAGNYSNFKLVNIDSYEQLRSVGSSATIYKPYEGTYVTNNSGSASNNNALGGANAPFISPYVLGDSGTTANRTSYAAVSEYVLHSLHALTDYMKRHQLAGSRAFDRYLARFGKALSAEKMNRCVYLGAAMQDIQIGDVTATSDTEGASLGAFAGRGISYGNGHFSFDSDEFGYFIVLSTIVPATGYYQGIDPLTERTSKLQFFTPEFDSLGVEPIGAVNLYMPQLPPEMNTGSKYDQIFGYVPRYAAYKSPTCSDRLTGNFRLRSLAGTNGAVSETMQDSWHLMRRFNGITDFSRDWANVVHTPDFISGHADFADYKRIFYSDAADSPDNFIVIHNFEIAEYAPMKALYDSYEFEDKGKKVTLETNGVKMN